MVGTRYPSRATRSQTVAPDDPFNAGIVEDILSSAAPVGREYDPLATDFKAVMAVISQLDGLGLGNLNIQLPKCVVLGEQSTGKSSVIESISGIKTPRSTDTCTRCPLLINLIPADDHNNSRWSARVYIRSDFEFTPNAGRGQYHGRAKWVPLAVPRVTEFATTHNPQDLEQIISHAQAAILNPADDPSTFVPSSVRKVDLTKRKIQFSPNLVGIEISQPGIAALSFIDLPGIIAQTEDAESQYLVAFVRDLVTRHIKDSNTLILVTCSLATDIANSTAASLARENSALGRCVGVLTKPDLLPLGSKEEKLRCVLSGDIFKLGHGYFVVKNPAQDAIDAGLSHSYARQQEQMFFDTSYPWSNLGSYRDQFGTPNLQAYLSKTLATQSLKALPNIEEQIEVKLHSVTSQLAQIPQSPSHDAARIIRELLTSFCEHVRKEMEGELPYVFWRNAWEVMRGTFAKNLSDLKPLLKTSGKLDTGIFHQSTASGRSIDQSIIILSDDDEDTVMSTETPSKKRRIEPFPQTPIKAMPLAMRSRSVMGTPAPPVSSPATISAMSTIRTPGNQLRKVFILDEVVAHLNSMSKSRIPKQLQPKVVEGLILSTMEHWDGPLATFFGDFESILRGMMEKLFTNHFQKWDRAKIHTEAWDVIDNVLKCHFTEQKHSMAAESLADEMEGPYIFPSNGIDKKKEDILASYRAARITSRTKVYHAEYQETYDRPPPTTPAEKEKIRQLAADEPYELAIDTVATVTAYYDLASHRFHDAVCMRIESKFFKMLRTKLCEELESSLGIFDPEEGAANSIRLLAQPEDREQERSKLLAYENALKQGQTHLRNLKAKYGEFSGLGG